MNSCPQYHRHTKVNWSATLVNLVAVSLAGWALCSCACVSLHLWCSFDSSIHACCLVCASKPFRGHWSRSTDYHLPRLLVDHCQCCCLYRGCCVCWQTCFWIVFSWISWLISICANPVTAVTNVTSVVTWKAYASPMERASLKNCFQSSLPAMILELLSEPTKWYFLSQRGFCS